VFRRELAGRRIVYCSDHHLGNHTINNRQSFSEIQDEMPEYVVGLVISSVVIYKKDSGMRSEMHFISAVFPINFNDDDDQSESQEETSH
jgi:hypothetical protein